MEEKGKSVVETRSQVAVKRLVERKSEVGTEKCESKPSAILENLVTETLNRP